jgi:hypothetical protein
VECSEEEHQQNRRTELRITGISEKTNWKPLQQIIEEEELERENKGKSRDRRQRRFQEANTSAQLPELKPDVQKTTVLIPPVPTPPSANDPGAENSENSVRILALPPTFKGCAVELIRSETEISASHAYFKGYKEIFRLLENDGKFSYLLANLGTKDATTAFFKKKVRPVNKTARLVLYTAGGKEYLE